jgi:hypothetical protein
MIRAVRAELRKLRGPVLLCVTIVVMLFSVFFGVMSHETASTQLQSARHQLEWLATDSLSPEDMGMTPGPEFEEPVAQQKSDAERWLKEVERDVALARATQSPLGAGGLAAGLMGSALGIFALLVLAGFHVAGEWSRNSIKEVLVQTSRRAQLVVAKLVSLWIAGMWLLVASWVAFALWGLVSRRVFPIPVASSPEAVGWSLALLAKAPLVILAVAALGVLAGVLVRSPIGALSASMLAVVGAALVGGSVQVLTKYSPAVWIADWMGFETRQYLVYFLWLRKVRQVNELFMALALACLVLIITAAAVVIMKRRDALN